MRTAGDKLPVRVSTILPEGGKESVSQGGTFALIGLRPRGSETKITAVNSFYQLLTIDEKENQSRKLKYGIHIMFRVCMETPFNIFLLPNPDLAKL